MTEPPQSPPQIDSTDSLPTTSALKIEPSPPTVTQISLRPRKIQKHKSPDEENSPENDSPEPSKPTKSKQKRKRSTPVTKLVPQRITTKPNKIAAVRSLSCDGELELALRHLRISDPLLSPLIDLHQPPTFDTFNTPFLALTKSILYQQVAYKAGQSIYTRFIALCGGESSVVPSAILDLNPQQLRHIGVSNRKASYLHDLARKYTKGILSDSLIMSLDDKSLYTMLTMVNGIGSWSVHMFMIFSLHRPDVLPVNDLGVRKGVQSLYELVELPRPSQMEQLCEKWKPYRSVGAWYMWRFVEAKGGSSNAVVATGVGNGSSSLQQQQKEQLQQPLQFLDPISGILNTGTCAWGQ